MGEEGEEREERSSVVSILVVAIIPSLHSSVLPPIDKLPSLSSVSCWRFDPQQGVNLATLTMTFFSIVSVGRHNAEEEKRRLIAMGIVLCFELFHLRSVRLLVV